jgi:hypothetical protein
VPVHCWRWKGRAGRGRGPRRPPPPPTQTPPLHQEKEREGRVSKRDGEWGGECGRVRGTQLGQEAGRVGVAYLGILRRRGNSSPPIATHTERQHTAHRGQSVSQLVLMRPYCVASVSYLEGTSSTTYSISSVARFGWVFAPWSCVCRWAVGPRPWA